MACTRYTRTWLPNGYDAPPVTACDAIPPPRRRLILSDLKHPTNCLDLRASAPPSDEGTRESCIREVEGHCVVEHPAHSRGRHRPALRATILVLPYAIALADGGLMALAALWENWRSSAGEWVRSFAIITTTPNELCAELHNRMPVVLAPERWPAWLGEEPADPRQLKALLAPYPSPEMTCWPVSPRVGNVKNNDASLIEPIALQV